MFFVGLFGLLVAAAVIIPLVFDVDKYRPQIVSKANEYINGSLEVGKLTLSLWGKLMVKVDGIRLSDSKNRSVVEVKDVQFVLPWKSVFQGAPELRLELDSPTIHVLNERTGPKTGTLNVSTLVKSRSSQPPANIPSGGQNQPSDKVDSAVNHASFELPAIALAARLTFMLNHANITYKDEISGDTYRVEDLGFYLKDISLTRNMPFELVANLDLTVQKLMRMKGPLVIKGAIQPLLSQGILDKAAVKVDVLLDDVDLKYPEMLQKPKGVPFGASVDMIVGQSFVEAKTLRFIFSKIIVDGQLNAKNFSTIPTFDFMASSNRIDLGVLAEICPMVKAYKPNGFFEMEVKAWGPTNKIEYSANAKFGNIQIQHETMLQPLTASGNLAVVTDNVKEANLKLNGNNFDLVFQGNIQRFLAPLFRFNIGSNNMDLDGLLKPSQQAAQVRKQKAQAAVANPSAPSGASQKPVVDYNAMFAPLRQNPMFANVAGTVDFKLNRVKTTGIVIKNAKGKFSLKDLMLALNGFSMELFDGSIKADTSFNVRTAKPEVGAKLLVSGLQTQRMLESQMPFLRNTASGSIAADVNIGGVGINPDDVMMHWKGGGNFSMRNAIFTTFDIGREIRDGAVQKLPPQARDRIKSDRIQNLKGEYDSLVVKFGLKDGVFSIIDLVGKAKPNKGLDMYGTGTIKFPSYEQNLFLDIVDTYNMTNGDSIAKSQKYRHFTLSPIVRGTVFQPQFDWGATVGKLAQDYMRTQGAEKARAFIDKAVGNKLPPKAKEQLDKLLGKPQQQAQPNQQKPAEAAKDAVKKLFGR